MTQTNTQTTILFPDEYRETELYEALAAQEAEQAAVEHDFRVHINTRAIENRAAQLQQAMDKASEAARVDEQAQEARRQEAAKRAKAARKRARETAFYRRMACCLIAAAVAYILMLIGAVSPVITVIVGIVALIWVCWEMFWIIRRAIRFWTRKEEEHHA